MRHEHPVPSSQRPLSSERVRRLLWSSLTSLVLAAQLTGALHLALVSHALCAEHGRFVHEVNGGSPGALVLAAGSVDVTLTDDPPSEDDDDHDHCVLQVDGHDYLLGLGGPCLELPVPTGDLPGLHAPAGRPALRALYRVAPKQSPPA